MLKNISISLIFLILKSILSLYLFKVITDTTLPSTYAPYGVSLVFIGLLTTIGSVGLGPALVRSKYISVKKINTYIIFSLILGLGLGLGLVLSADSIQQLLKIPDSKLYIQLVAPIVIVKLVSMIYEAVLQRKLKIREIVNIDFYSFIVMHFLLQIVVLKSGIEIYWLIICVFIEEIIKLSLYKAKSETPFSTSYDFKKIKEDIGFSGVLTINRIINYINSQLDKLYVSNQLNPTDFSGYSRVFQLINFPITIIGQLFDKVIYPILCDRLRANQSAYNIITIGVLLLLGFVGTIICYYLGSYIEKLFLNGEWSDYIDVYYLLIFIIPVRLVDRYSSVVLNAIGRPLVRTWSQLIFISSLIIGLIFVGDELKHIALISIFSYSLSALVSITYLVIKYEK
ncbi:oligosaccharide flippase family protein [Vibrio sp. Vb2424]|nr:oligosaccharide flippase family protein [Vibrio sp. Vb2424]